MTAVVGFLTVLLPLLYLLLWGSYLWFFFEERRLAHRAGSVLTIVVMLIHTLWVVLRTMELGRFPLGTPLGLASLLALSLTTIYVVIEKVLRVRQTGFLVLGLAFLLQFLASGFSTARPTINPLLNDPGYALHATLILLAYTSFSLSFLYAVLFQVQERQLQRRSFGLLFRRLPPLDVLERMSVMPVRLGVPLLFLGLATGHLWMYRLRDHLPVDQAMHLTPFDPKILMSWGLLIIYGVGLLGHDRWGWRGRRMSRLSVTAWVVVVALMGIAQHVFTTFHDFSLRGGA